MSSIDIISMSLRNLFKRKMRTFLTILGVVIGTTAIIVMISLGLAINQGFQESVDQMGDIRILTVRSPGGNNNYYSMGAISVSSSSSSSSNRNEKLSLNDQAVDSFRKIPHVEAATPMVQISMTAVSGKYVTWLNIKGIDPSTMEAFGYKVQEGTLLKGDKYGIVFGSDVAYDFYNPNDRNYWRNIDWSNRTANVNVMEDKIEMSFEDGYGYNYDSPFDGSYTESEEGKQKPKPYKLTVNGVLAPVAWETDYYVFMDIEDVLKIKLAQQRYQQNESSYNYGRNSSFSSNEFDTVMVKCDNIDNVEAVMAEIEKTGFYVDSYYIEVLRQMQETSRSNQIFLGAIGAVSFVVAAIGIANTMFMAIYERTREIGVMKVIGASIKDIKRLFLLEAMLIGFLGGALGIGLSLGLSQLLNTYGASIALGILGGAGMGSSVSLIPLWLCGTALVFSSLVGLISGYFPARRAMNLSALDAIRTE